MCESEPHFPWTSSRPDAVVTTTSQSIEELASIEATATEGHRLFLPRNVLAVPDRAGLFLEQTPFLRCADALHVMVSYLPLGDLQAVRRVNRLWNALADDRLSVREEEMERFIVAYNAKAAAEFNSTQSLSLERSAQALWFALNFVPCCVLPWIYLSSPFQWPWNASDRVFDILLLMTGSLTVVLAVAGWLVLSPRYGAVQSIVMTAVYFVAACCFAAYLLSQRWPKAVFGSDILTGQNMLKLLPFYLATLVLMSYSIPAYPTVALMAAWHIQLQRNLQRRKLRSLLKRRAAPSSPRGAGEGVFAHLRRSLSIMELEQLMADSAEPIPTVQAEASASA